jgi:hypothetical protein
LTLQYIGFVGYSDVKDKETETKMRQVVKDIFNTLPKDVAVVTGCTNLGISKYVYEEAASRNISPLIGIMAKEGYQYELYPCDIIYAQGNNFGEERDLFIDMIDVLYKIGGGNQSQKEFQMALDKNIPCFEVGI